MAVKLRKRKQGGGQTWLYLDIIHNRKRWSESLGLHLNGDKTHNRETLALAKSIEAKRQLELQSAPHGYVPEFKKNADFMEYFGRLAAARDKCWRSTFFHLQSYQRTPLPFRLLDATWLEGFKSYLGNTVSANTAGTYYSKVKAALKIALKEKLISENPSVFVDSPKGQPTHRKFLSVDDLHVLARTPCADPEVRRAFFFACYTGLRISDIRKLTWAEIVNDRIHFTQKKTGGAEYLPLNDFAKSLLGATKLPEEHIFILPPSDWTIWDMIQKWSESAGLRAFSFHASRHTFATQLISNGADLYTVSKLLGHTDIKHTQIYAKIVDERKNQAVNLLPSMVLSN